MKTRILVALLFPVIICSGCVSPVNGLSSQMLSIESKIDKNNAITLTQAENSKKLSAQIQDLNDQVKALADLLQKEASASRKLEAQVDAMQKNLADSKGQGAPGMRGNVSATVSDMAQNFMGEFRNRLTDQISEQLKLNDDQKTKVKDAMEKAQETIGKNMADMRESGKFDREKMRKTMEEATAQTEESLKTVLTPEQMAEYKKLTDRWQMFGRDQKDGGNRGSRRRGDNNDQPGEQSARPGAKPATPDNGVQEGK